MQTITKFKTTLILLLALTILSACGGEEKTDTKENTIIDHKLQAVNAAKQNVAQLNTQIEEVNSIVKSQTELISASSLYATKCSSCHGSNAEKSALNNSQNISVWTSKQIQDALIGYNNGSYGGKMKAIMQAQSKALSDEQIKLISDYITSL